MSLYTTGRFLIRVYAYEIACYFFRFMRLQKNTYPTNVEYVFSVQLYIIQ